MDLTSLENGIIGASTVPPDLLEKMKNDLKLKGGVSAAGYVAEAEFQITIFNF